MKDKVCLITGAGRGIGKTIATTMRAAGARVVIAELDAESGATAAAEIGSGTLSLACDVTDPASVQNAVEQTIARFGRIDVLVNNAAINMSTSALSLKKFWEISPEEWDLVMRVNATGTFLVSRAVAPHMMAAGSGRIINMSSTTVTLGRPNYLHYVSSKAAIVGMTRSMARELGPSGITVNAILAGPIKTEVERKPLTPEQEQSLLDMQCIPRQLGPSDLTGTVLFLASEASALVTGQSIPVDGGGTHS